jgi:putative transposase
MDGKRRWADNIMIERWFRTLKYDEVYLNDYSNIRDAKKKIGNFINTYNYSGSVFSPSQTIKYLNG